jgi:hypothetical protein
VQCNALQVSQEVELHRLIRFKNHFSRNLHRAQRELDCPAAAFALKIRTPAWAGLD